MESRRKGLSSITQQGVKNTDQGKQSEAIMDSVRKAQERARIAKEQAPPKPPKQLTTRQAITVMKEMTKGDEKKLAAERTKIMRQVSLYKARFGDKYNFKGAAYKEPSASAPNEEWKALLDAMKAEIASKNAVPQFKSKWEWLISGLHMMWMANPDFFPDPTDNNKPMDLSNLPQVLSSEHFYDQVDDEINQIVIEYEWMFSSGPIMRFVQASGMTLMQVNQINKARKAQMTKNPTATSGPTSDSMSDSV